MKKKSSSPEGRRINSIEVGFRVIKALEAAEGYLSLKDISSAAGMPSGKAYLYLFSLMREGFVAQDPTSGHYGLGPFALQIGLSAIRQIDLVALARDGLMELSRSTSCTAYLSAWSNRGPVLLSKVEGNPQSLFTVRVGFVFPLLSSATGQVFLAYQPDSETAPLLMQEGGTANLTEVQKQALVKTIRRRGYASSERRIKADILSFSAPVFDYSGEIAAAVTIVGSVDALQQDRRTTALSALLGICVRLSERQGGVFKPSPIDP